MVDERGPDIGLGLAIIVVAVVVVDSLDLRQMRRWVVSCRSFVAHVVVVFGFSGRCVLLLLLESSVFPSLAVSVAPPVVPPGVVTATGLTTFSLLVVRTAADMNEPQASVVPVLAVVIVIVGLDPHSLPSAVATVTSPAPFLSSPRRG